MYRDLKIAKMAARDRGDMFFMVPTPCKSGHYAKRYSSTGGCVECLTPGKGTKALSAIQQQVLQVATFRTLLPKEADLADLMLHLASCVYHWERKNGIASGLNNWGPKINWALENKKPIGEFHT